MESLSLIQLLEPYKVIATMGSCKNAGKTTVLNYIVEQLHNDYIVGVTSIGYDGEETDAITLLPKPRINVHPFMLVATSQSCLDRAEIEYEIVEDVHLNTAIGKIYIVRIMSNGFIEISGPSIRSELDIVSKRMIELGCVKVLLDGAAGRLSFGTIADAAIVSIGAAMSTDMQKVIKKSNLLLDLLQLPLINQDLKLPTVQDVPYKLINIENKDYIIMRGTLVDQDLIDILSITKQKTIKSMEVVVNDPSAVFISNRIWQQFKSHGGSIKVRKSIQLIAITLNPMSPYGEWFDSEVFMTSMKEVTNLPVYNVIN